MIRIKPPPDPPPTGRVRRGVAVVFRHSRRHVVVAERLAGPRLGAVGDWSLGSGGRQIWPVCCASFSWECPTQPSLSVGASHILLALVIMWYWTPIGLIRRFIANDPMDGVLTAAPRLMTPREQKRHRAVLQAVLVLVLELKKRNYR